MIGYIDRPVIFKQASLVSLGLRFSQDFWSMPPLLTEARMSGLRSDTKLTLLFGMPHKKSFCFILFDP